MEDHVYQCFICTFGTNRPLWMSQHMYQVHLNSEKVVDDGTFRLYCPICDIGFELEADYDKHCQDDHQGLILKCPECPVIKKKTMFQQYWSNGINWVWHLC